MTCQTYGNESAENPQFCVGLGAALGSATASGIRGALKVWPVGGLNGLVQACRS